MRYKQTNERRAVILMVVLALLTLFAIVGITFVLYADAEAASARVAREAETQQRADVDPQQALAFFLGQLIYDVPDMTTGSVPGMRGHSLARTMYGYNSAAANAQHPFNGVGRLHYPASRLRLRMIIHWSITPGFPAMASFAIPERYERQPRQQSRGGPELSLCRRQCSLYLSGSQ